VQETGRGFRPGIHSQPPMRQQLGQVRYLLSPHSILPPQQSASPLTV